MRQHTKGKILVLDDELDSLSKIYLTLLKKDFEVEISVDAREMLLRAERFKPDVVIINNDVPFFDGIQICHEVKDKLHMPVVLLLDKHSSLSVKLDGCSADDILYKPVEINTLLHIIHRMEALNQ